MQKYTGFYRKLAYCGLISDFSKSFKFLVHEADFTILCLISVILARVYEMLLSLRPLKIMHLIIT